MSARQLPTAAGAAASAPTAVRIGTAGLDPADLEGVEVLRRMRRTALNTPVLMLTARDSLEERIAALDAGADDYLTKPFELQELNARVRAQLRRRRTKRIPAGRPI